MTDATSSGFPARFIGIMPVIGIPLPFFSYGGSSIVTLFAAMGVVSGIKKRSRPEWLIN